MVEQTIRVPTTDDWYPNYPGDTVELSLLNLLDGEFRVCVWGADDFGLEKDFKNPKEALRTYRAVKNSCVVTKASLYDMGFETA